MKRIITVSIVLTIHLLSFCQTDIDFDKKIDSLKLVQKSLNEKVKCVNEELENLEYLRLKRMREAKMSSGVEIFARHNASLYSGRGTWYKEITSIPPNTSLLAYEYESNYYLVAYDTLTGYVFSSDVETINQRTKRKKDQAIEAQKKELLKKQMEQEAFEAKQRRIQQEKERRDRLRVKYGENNGNDIAKRLIWLGMTREMVIDSWGKPRDINRSVGSWGNSSLSFQIKC